jgi:hypothetical protein
VTAKVTHDTATLAHDPWSHTLDTRTHFGAIRVAPRPSGIRAGLRHGVVRLFVTHARKTGPAKTEGSMSDTTTVFKQVGYTLENRLA